MLESYQFSSTIMKKEYVAFEGKEFTIEWYFDSKGKSLALEYFESLREKDQLKVIDLFKRSEH